jgi:tRNA threonylcarbamoyladenosine biosynthesis protein TsaE
MTTGHTAMRRTIATNSVEGTEALGERLGARLFPGAVVTLEGDLGAGKTALIRGVCRGAGCRVRASSPTYALMHLYEGPVPVCHFDLYRVARTDEWVAMEVEEQMDGHHIVLIEWPEPVAGLLPADRLGITITPGAHEEQRIFALAGDGDWQRRLEGLTE